MAREVSGKGKWGEDQATAFLARNGFGIIERNYNTIVGEIDIVAHKGGDLYFVEVKTRSAGPFANDLAVTREKLRKFKKTMARYCTERRIVDRGLIPASVMVIFDRTKKTVNFRFAVMY